MIGVREVTVRYPRARADALHGVSLDAPRGRITAIVGPNGSGKSTLVRALLKRQPLVAGRIELDDRSIHDIPARELATRLAVVTQREEPAFPIEVREYVRLGRFPHLGTWRAPGEEDRAAVERALVLAGVEELAHRRVDTLSGGEWQRARLARALAQGGMAIVLDEPTTFLDVAHEMAVFELLSRLAHQDGQAVLLVSHQLNLVARFADRMVLLHRGVVAAAGAPLEIMQGPVLERVYEWPVVVARDPAVGAPMLVPLRGRVPR
ncbi:MAG TPA: ABC transporter ATP-binding protein [Gemmatimonadaceae bacterium]|nr:ABC transporter ATP-binding protein [Gemmatimonadaceae bacterium]